MASFPPELFVPVLIFVIAALYSSVGHGGASGYLMIMSLLAYSPRAMAPSALALNIVVAGIAFVMLWRSGFFSWSLTWPFVLLASPFAFLGGVIHVPDSILRILLGIALATAATRLWLPLREVAGKPVQTSPKLPVALSSGAAIGLVSGMIGIGGGIFLSPLLILRRWADPKQAAASSAFFIVLNSIAGLSGKFTQGATLSDLPLPFLISAIGGGLLGSSLAAKVLPMMTLRRVLAAVLLLASVKLIGITLL
jgi:uncharacterized membrane protein YfcA